MKVDVKEYMSDDGSSISIESGDTVPIVNSAKFVGIYTNNSPEHDDLDELWIFRRKAFLKAVAEALNVLICDRYADDIDAGYYK